ncbi:MAG: tyrosine--tRNA ligase [Candidatus Altiarchaeota archaeon]
MDDSEILERNLVEVVTKEELKNLLSINPRPTTYCGFEVSGPVHIGHMVSILKQMDFQKLGWNVKILFADVHTLLNCKGEEDWINRMIKYWETSFRALGLDKAEFVRGSSFQFEKEYVKDVLGLGLHSTLNRALRSMQEIARDIEHAKVSQVIYPLMQIADVKALEVDVAHGGMEQRKIHMLARESLPQIGGKKPICTHGPLLCSLQGPEVKMSSSKPETMIAVDDSPDEIKKKIQSAFCPPEEMAGNPIAQIAEYVIFPRLGELEVVRPQKFGGDVSYNSIDELGEDYSKKRLHPADLKNAVSESLADLLKPVREELGKKKLTYSEVNST